MSEFRTGTIALGVVLMLCATAFAGMCIPVFADDSDAASYSYSANSIKKIELSPVPGDVITITDVSSISGCPYAVLNTSTHVATVTIPQMAAGKYTTYDSYLFQSTNGDRCYLELHTSEHWPTGKVENYFYEVTDTVYVRNGTVVSFTATYNDTDEETYYLAYEKVTYVTPGVGLTLNNGSLSGTVNAPAGTTIYIDWVTHYDFVEDGITDYGGRITLAVVSPNYTHTVTYSANGGSGSMEDTKVTDSSSGSTNVTLASCGFTKSGYHFVGWKVGNTIYQPGQTVSVGANDTMTATAQWEANTLTLGSVAKQYAVAGKSVSFNASATSNPSGASISFAKSNVSNGLTVSISGNVVTCSASTPGTYTFTLTANATGYTSASTTVTVQVVPVLAFTNSPTAGALNA